ncbi:hypothetical protein NBRC116592_36060 [Colwellia sp. KU-HH00111]|uniref:transglutaminase-like domain-containing protein n=1 Tax=Colwellia sp. KU-HH00111 TaxID=3127652 RepID=UPI003101CFA0
MNIKMNQSSVELEVWRSSPRFIRNIAIVIMSCYLFVFYSPSVQAITHAKAPSHIVLDAIAQLMEELQQLATETAHYLKYKFDKRQRQQATVIYQNKIKALALLLDKHRDASEKQIRDDLLQATNSKSIKQAALYQKQLSALLNEYDRLNIKIEAILQAERGQYKAVLLTATSLEKQLSTIKFGKAHHEYDSENMPFGPLSSAVYKPAQNNEQLKQRLLLEQETSAIQKSSKSLVTAESVTTSSEPLAAEAENLSDYLTFNVDNQSTSNLIDLAESLNHDAVNIYQYVYNNVEYVPAHGSIQGADYTAQSLRGGAMDQASLLIALLRLSNIPARYVYGSVTLDINQAMNWVGGVETPEATQNILSQGGVPNVLIADAQGTVKQIDIEHVWVEVNQNDQWTALDPSFKQYQYTEAIDIKSAIDLNGQTIIDNITAGATINESEGWAQNINQTAIDTELAGIQTQIKDYINRNYPNATVEDIIGSKEIIATNAIQLPNQLPYEKVITSESLIDLPDNLRHKFGFELKNESGTSYLTFERSLPELAGKRLAVSFPPATPSDEQALLDLLPENIETEEQLPSELPYGAFNVTANISLNEEVVQTSTANFAFGQELSGHKGFWSPRFNWEKKSSVLIAGEYQAIGIDTHGVSDDALLNVKVLLENTKNNIENNELNSVTELNSIGVIMQAGIYSYLVATKARSDITAVASKVVSYRQPSYGTFGSSLSVSYYFGVPSKVGFGGVAMDIDKLADNAESTSNCWNDWSEFNKQTGAMLSYLENVIPEQLFSTETEQVDGISAVKALAIASQQGQKIYTLTSVNANLLTEVTIDSASRQEIQSALATGKEVTVHQEPIDEFGWTGSGYVVIDPDTGAGGYIITGGENGAKAKVNYLKFWGGAIRKLLESNYVAKALVGSAAQALTALTNAYKFFTECASLVNAIILTMVFTLISVAIATAIFFVPVGGLVISLVFGYIESLLADYVISKGC